jgi:hypothetical protein
MPYIFPKRKLQDQDILDPTELNEDITPSADLYSGNLDEQNFKRRSFGPDIATDVAPSAAGSATPILSNSYWNLYYSHKVVDPEWGTPDSYNNPSARNTSVRIANTPSWQSIDDLSLTIVTGNSRLWVVAHFQYHWAGFEVYGGHHFSYPPDASDPDAVVTNLGAWGRYPAMIQFAVRVDGQIIEETKTGLHYPHEKVTLPFKAQRQRDDGETSRTDAKKVGSPLPGPGQDGEPNCGGLSAEVGVVRLGSFIPVSPGSHVIDVVGRRISTTAIHNQGTADDTDATNVSYETDNKILVHNRQIFVADFPILAPANSGSASVDAPAFETEDTISEASLGTDRIDLVRYKYNNIQPGALSRGALNNRQMDSRIGYAGSAQLTPITKSSTFAAWYPGFGEDTHSVNRSGNVGWYGPLEDGTTASSTGSTSSTGVLELAPSSAGIGTFDGEHVLLLLGNVELHRLNQYDPVASKFHSACNEFCAFCFFISRDGGSAVQAAITEAVVNRDTNLAPDKDPTAATLGQGKLDPVAHDVPLLQVLKIGGASTDSNGNTMVAYYASGTTINTIGVYGATMSPGAQTTGSYPWHPDNVASAGPVSEVYVSAEYWRGYMSVFTFNETDRG